MAPPLPLRFVLSAPDLSTLPDSPGEVAVAGRSNVGKSSLINAVANRRSLAQVSRTPGRTRLLNLFAVDGPDSAPGTIVDLPGYGYAAVPGQIRARWPHMIEGYLVGRQPLRMVAVLVDGEIGPTPLDLQMLNWLRAHDLPHSVIATKHDKVPSTRRQRRKRDLAAACALQPNEVSWVSAAKGTGIDQLRTTMRIWLTASH
jgi:GTP-binding protein